MDKQKRYALATGAALLLSLGGVAAAAMPALAENGTAAPSSSHGQSAAQGHEDGTNDGEQADDQNEPKGTEQADDAAHEKGEKGEKKGAEGAEHSEKGEKGESRDAETKDDHGTKADPEDHDKKGDQHDTQSDGETADDAAGAGQ